MQTIQQEQLRLSQGGKTHFTETYSYITTTTCAVTICQGAIKRFVVFLWARACNWLLIDTFRPEDKTHMSQMRNILNTENVTYNLTRNIGLSIITQMQWTQPLNIDSRNHPVRSPLRPDFSTDRELALTGWRTALFPSLVIFLFTPRPGICQSIQRASAGLPVGIWMMNVRVKLSIFHIHNSPHTTRLRAVVIGSEAPRRLRRTVKKNTHIWMWPRATGALWKHRITHRNWTDMERRHISQGPFKCSLLFIGADGSNLVTLAESVVSIFTSL